MNLSDAVHATVHDYPGGSESLAPRLGMTGAVLRNKANPNNNSNHFTLADANKAMTMTGDYRIMHALADEHDFICIPKKFDVPASDDAILELVTMVWRTNGDVGKAVDDALADGRITTKELSNIKDTISNVERAMHTLLARITEIAE